MNCRRQKAHNFLARILFTENVQRKAFIYRPDFNDECAQRREADVKSVKTRDSLINSVPRIGRCSVQTTLSALNKIPLLQK